MSKHSIKEVIKEMCKALPGGRSAMAGALGMSLETFNNKLYEKNGCRFFDIDEQEAMEDISGTKLLVEYHLDRHGMSALPKIEAEKIDQVELFDMRMTLAAMQGSLAVLIQESLVDGVLTDEEIGRIYRKAGKVFAYAIGFLDSLKVLYGEKQEATKRG